MDGLSNAKPQKSEDNEEFGLLPRLEAPSQWAPTMGQQSNKIIKRRRRADYLKRKNEQAKLGGIVKKPSVKKDALAKKASAKKAPAKKAPAKKATKKVATDAKSQVESTATELETTMDMVTETAEQTATETVVETAEETAPEPVAEPVAETAPEPVVETAPEPVVETAPEATEPAAS